MTDTGSHQGSSGNVPTAGEIDLLQYWHVVKRHLPLILAVALAGALVAGVVSYLIPPVFESRMVVEVGQVGQPPGGDQAATTQIETAQALSDELSQKYGLPGVGGSGQLPRIEAATVVPGGNPPSLVEIRASSGTPEEGVAFLRRMAEDVLREHHVLFVDSLAASRREKHRQQVAAGEAEKDVALLREQLQARPGGYDALSTIVLLEKIQQRFSESVTLQDKATAAGLALSPLVSRETTIVSAPAASEVPIRPQRLRMVLFAAVMALVLGVVLAFAREALDKAKDGSMKDVRS